MCFVSCASTFRNGPGAPLAAAPALLGEGGAAALAVLPLQSWYHAGFMSGGPAVDMPRGHPLHQMDGGCKWPAALGERSTSADLARSRRISRSQARHALDVDFDGWGGYPAERERLLRLLGEAAKGGGKSLKKRTMGAGASAEAADADLP